MWFSFKIQGFELVIVEEERALDVILTHPTHEMFLLNCGRVNGTWALSASRQASA